MNALKGECLCLREISIKVNKFFIVICVFCLRLTLQYCCCMFTCLSSVFYTGIVVACLLLYPLTYGYTDDVAIFLFFR